MSEAPDAKPGGSNDAIDGEILDGRSLTSVGDGERRGPGRPKGSLNQTTVAMRTAIARVFADMQQRHGGEGPYPHFLEWAEANPTEFYRIAARQLPVPLEATGQAIGLVVWRGLNDED